MDSVGKRIKDRRKELRLTQTDIKKLVGISSGNISEIENGNRLPAAGTLVQLASVLQCSVDWILTGVSPIQERPPISANGEIEEELLRVFRQLDPDDRSELVEIAQMKLSRRARGGAGSSSSGDPDRLKAVAGGDGVSA